MIEKWICKQCFEPCRISIKYGGRNKDTRLHPTMISRCLIESEHKDGRGCLDTQEKK